MRDWGGARRIDCDRPIDLYLEHVLSCPNILRDAGLAAQHQEHVRIFRQFGEDMRVISGCGRRILRNLRGTLFENVFMHRVLVQDRRAVRRHQVADVASIGIDAVLRLRGV